MSTSPVIEFDRCWPDYFIEHKALLQPMIYQIGTYPVWSLSNLEGWAANSIESSDGTYADAIGNGSIQTDDNREAAIRVWTYLDPDYFADRIVLR